MRASLLIRRQALVGMSVLGLTGCVYQHARSLQTPPTPTNIFDSSRPGEPPNPTDRYYYTALTPGEGNSDTLFVAVTFSGGGTRAAALAYGILDELRRVQIPLQPGATGGGTTTSLLNEVDVISSVSGGSFTAAYYALHGNDIFNPAGDFTQHFLHYNVEGQLFGRAVYYPQNWLRLLSRPEIAAHLYSDLLFHNATYADLLARKRRPFVILNTSDYRSQFQFQFTQDRFDQICVDLNSFPLSRAVAASSAFPGLLNSLTLNTFNAANGNISTCPVLRPPPDWVTNGEKDQYLDRVDYRAALAYHVFSNKTNRYLHLLDGGLTDNLGLRPIYEGLKQDGSPSVPLLQMANTNRIVNLLVIVVNARTGDKSTKIKQPDNVPIGPLTLPVIGATSSIPMGTVTYDSVDLLTEFIDNWTQQQRRFPALPQMRIHAVEVTFDNIQDQHTRNFFKFLPTDFALPPGTVDCLVVEGRRLLAAARPYGGQSGTDTFAQYVEHILHGTVRPETEDVAVTGSTCHVVKAGQ